MANIAQYLFLFLLENVPFEKFSTENIFELLIFIFGLMLYKAWRKYGNRISFKTSLKTFLTKKHLQNENTWSSIYNYIIWYVYMDNFKNRQERS